MKIETVAEVEELLGELSAEQRARVEALAVELRRFLKVSGPFGEMALAIVGAELAASLEDEP